MDFLYIILIWLSSLVLGRVFLKIFRIEIDEIYINLISISIGWALLSFYILFLTVNHLLYKEVVLYSLVLLGIGGLYEIRNIDFIPRLNLNFKINKFNILLILLIVYLSLFNLADVFAPPTVADSLVYHFKIPIRYIEENGLFYNPFFHYNAPHLLEIFSIIGFILESESLAHLQYYSFNFLILWVLLTLSKRYFGSYEIGLFAFAIYFVMPMITSIKSAGYVEVGLSLATILSILMLFESIKEKIFNINYFILSAVFLGIALSIKYYGLFTLVITITVFIFYFLKNKIDIAESLKYTSLYIFFVIIFGSVFYILNFLNTGNPIYPAMFGLFGGQDYSAELNALMKEMTTLNKRPAGEGLWGFVTSLWGLTMEGDRFLSGRNGYGPILLLLPLFLIKYSSRISKENIDLILFFIVYIIGFWILWYLFAIQRGRHFLPFVVMLIFIISIKIHDIKGKNYYDSKILKYSVNSFWAIFFTFSLAVHFLFTKQFISVSTGKVSKDVYLEAKLPHYKAIQWINDNLPKNSYIYNLVNTREYYLKQKSFYPSPYYQGWYDFTKIKNVEVLYKKLKLDGFTHIVLKTKNIDTSNYRDPFRKNYFNLLNEVTSKYCTKIKVITEEVQATRTFGKLKLFETYVYEIN